MVDREQVLHVARLARLSLGDDEVERFAAQLGRILDYVDLLSEVDAEADAAEASLPDEAPPRPDEPAPCLPRDAVLARAPKADDETFLVPPVIEGGGSA